MKSTLVLAAVLIALAITTATAADEVFLSPRARAQADSLRRVPVTRTEPDLLKDRPVGNAKLWALRQSLRKAPSNGPSVDLVHGPRPLMSPKDPRYEAALRELSRRQFQVAPLK